MVPWKQGENSAKSFVSNRGCVEPKVQDCKLCGHSHPIWHYDESKADPWREDGKQLSSKGSSIDVRSKLPDV